MVDSRTGPGPARPRAVQGDVEQQRQEMEQNIRSNGNLELDNARKHGRGCKRLKRRQDAEKRAGGERRLRELEQRRGE